MCHTLYKNIRFDNLNFSLITLIIITIFSWLLKIQLCHFRNKLHVKIKQKSVVLKCNNISQYFCFYCVFDQINAAIVNKKDFFQNILKNLTGPKPLKGIC